MTDQVPPQLEKQKKNTLPHTMLVSLLVFSAVVWFLFLQNNSQTETQITGSNASELRDSHPLPGLLEVNNAYAEGLKYTQEGSWDEALASFESAKATVRTEGERAQIDVMIALVYRFTKPVESIGLFKEIALDSSLNNNFIKASAVENMVLAYYANPTQEIFNTIFSGPVFGELRASINAKPSQVDASLENLFSYATENIHALASIELRLANARLNNNSHIANKIISYCDANPDRIGDDSCDFNIDDILEFEEVVTYLETAQYVQEKLEQAEIDMDRIEDNAEDNLLTLALSLQARVLNKAVLYDIGSPEEVVQAFEEAMEFAGSKGFENIEASTALDYATFLGLWYWTPQDKHYAEVQEILAEFYMEDGKFTQTDIAISLSRAYQAERQDHSIAYENVIIGPALLSNIDPSFKNFLATKANWDFDDEVMQKYIK